MITAKGTFIHPRTVML